MKGRHISKKTQRRLTKKKYQYDTLSVSELSKLADSGDILAMRKLKRLCSYQSEK
jgi:hypothetical protein